MKYLTLLLIITSLQVKAQQTVPPRCIEVDYTHFKYFYDTVIDGPIYTYYIQTTAHANMGSLDRKGYPEFHQDEKLPKRWQVATKAKYKQWNRTHTAAQRRDVGHSAPYTALAYDSVGAYESMNIDQCGPQPSYFNEHQWEAVEMEVLKNLAPVQDSIEVFTGFIYDSLNAVPTPANIKHMIDVPEAQFYWKVIRYSKDGQVKYKAWLGLNEDSNRDTNPDDIICPVARIERLTGLRF